LAKKTAVKTSFREVQELKKCNGVEAEIRRNRVAPSVELTGHEKLENYR